MNKQTLLRMWDHLRQANGIAMRAIALLPADKLDSHPIPNMRTPKELVVHMYDVVFKAIAEGVLRGEVEKDEIADEKKISAGIKSRDDLLKFARQSWEAAERAVASITDSNLAASVKTPWGKPFPGFVLFGITHDEFLHHRGQLYAYLRALGVEPPMMWDFDNNAPEFRPQATTKA
jgi:uncharacterized damage-inducible protein DinB